jgi:hypothetical protein
LSCSFSFSSSCEYLIVSKGLPSSVLCTSPNVGRTGRVRRGSRFSGVSRLIYNHISDRKAAVFISSIYLFQSLKSPRITRDLVTIVVIIRDKCTDRTGTEGAFRGYRTKYMSISVCSCWHQGSERDWSILRTETVTLKKNIAVGSVGRLRSIPSS